MLLFSWPIVEARSKWGMQFIFLFSSEDLIQNPEMVFQRRNSLSSTHRQKRSRVIILSGDAQKAKQAMPKNSLQIAEM